MRVLIFENPVRKLRRKLQTAGLLHEDTAGSFCDRKECARSGIRLKIAYSPKDNRLNRKGGARHYFSYQNLHEIDKPDNRDNDE